jgi:hypothetical protein
MAIKALVAFAFGTILSSSAQAATCTYTLYPNQNAAGQHAAGEFRVTAKVGGNDNAGLASYGFTITGVATANHLAPWAPTAQKGAANGPAGFTWMRVEAPPFYIGYQDPFPNAFPVYGLGQTAGSFATQGITVVGPAKGTSWDAELLMAVGTFTGATPQFHVPDQLATVFISSTSRIDRHVDRIHFVIAPEPATRYLAVLAPTVLAVTRRRSAIVS